jgi:GNAT superfamily N-acetyltransferase
LENLEIRAARVEDLPAVVALLADDVLGAGRESLDDLTPYRAALARLAADSNQLLVVAERAGIVIGTLQLSVVPGLSRRGRTRAIIEAVRIHRDERGSGFGGTLIEWAVAEASARGCTLVQLTSDRSRTDAHRFYQRLGFTASHVGFKLEL